MKKDVYLKQYKLRVSGLRNALWGLLTLGLRSAIVTYKIEIIDSTGRSHELYNKFRTVYRNPFVKFYSFRFRIMVPQNFNPKHIRLWRMTLKDGSSMVLRNGINLETGYYHNGDRQCKDVRKDNWYTLHDTFRWSEITHGDDD